MMMTSVVPQRFLSLVPPLQQDEPPTGTTATVTGIITAMATLTVMTTLTIMTIMITPQYKPLPPLPPLRTSDFPVSHQLFESARLTAPRQVPLQALLFVWHRHPPSNRLRARKVLNWLQCLSLTCCSRCILVLVVLVIYINNCFIKKK